jgi:hypothetical protein
MITLAVSSDTSYSHKTKYIVTEHSNIAQNLPLRRVSREEISLLAVPRG